MCCRAKSSSSFLTYPDYPTLLLRQAPVVCTGTLHVRHKLAAGHERGHRHKTYTSHVQPVSFARVGYTKLLASAFVSLSPMKCRKCRIGNRPRLRFVITTTAKQKCVCLLKAYSPAKQKCVCCHLPVNECSFRYIQCVDLCYVLRLITFNCLVCTLAIHLNVHTRMSP